MLARVSRVNPDFEGLAEFYGATCPGLIGYLTVLGGNRADAEEIAQESFVRLLEHWPRVSEYDDPRAWLRQVATRMLISRARRRTVARLGLRCLGGATVSEPPTGDRLDLAAALAGVRAAWDDDGHVVPQRLVVLDVHGQRLLVQARCYDTCSRDDQDVLAEMVESITFPRT